MKKLLISLTSVIGLIPGLTIMISSIGVPPDQSQYLFGGIVEFFGFISLLCLYILRSKLNKLESSAKAFFTIIFGFLTLGFLSLYLYLSSDLIIEYENEKVLFPIIISTESLKNEIDLKGKVAFIKKHNVDGVKSIFVDKEQKNINLTNIIFLFNYIILFCCAIMSFGIYGVSQEDNKDINDYSI